MAIHYNSKIISDNLVLALDAANPKSYSGSGTAWSDLSGNGNTGTLVNGPTYNSGYGTVKSTGTRTDANASSLVLAIPMDGANNGTTFTDESANIKGSGSAKTITRSGAITSTTQSKFYGSSGYFDGSGDYLSCADSDDWYFSSGNSTAECWVYPTASPNQPILMGQWDGVGGGTGLSWVMILSNDSNRYLRALISSTGSGVDFDLISSTSLGLNQWNHCAFVRNGSTFTLYLNGVSVASTTNSNALFNATNSLTIGASTTGSQPFTGYLQDLRIYKGVAKYTSNFVPSGSPNTTPTGAFPIYNTKDVLGSLTFNGSSQYVNLGTPSISVGKITVNAWVRILTGSIYQHIVDSSSESWHLAIANNNVPYFWNGLTYHTAAPMLTVGNWYMITGVQGTTLDIYINGVLGQSIASNINVTTNNVVIAAYQTSPTRYLNGNISQVSIYNRALSASEISQNYNALKSRYV